MSIRTLSVLLRSCFAFALVLNSILSFAQPKITSFSPTSGPIGTTVTITGTGFSSIAANNIVYFGAVKAIVITATATSLSVKVPIGATFKPISVTNNGLTGYSSFPFKLIFSGGAGNFNEGSFSDPQDIYFNGNSAGGQSICSADFDGDGKLDLALVSNSSGLSVYRNATVNLSVSFEPPVTIAIGFALRNLCIADFNGDSKLDVAIIDQNTNSVAVAMNSSTVGNLSFASVVNFIVGIQPEGIASGDIDADGKPDIITTNLGDNSISVLRNTSSAANISFAPKVDLTTGSYPSAVAIGELNLDGKVDVVVPNLSSGTISVFRNTSVPGSVSFAAKVDFADASGTRNVAIGDIDGDGKADIATCNSITNTISVFRNTSTTATSITLAGKLDYGAIGGAAEVALEDMDGDGKTDIGVSSNSGTSMVIIRNISTSGTITLSPAASYVFCQNEALPNPECGNAISIVMADLNNDGRSDWASSLTLNLSKYRISKVGDPFISSFFPTVATAGATINISGYFLTGALSVRFGGTPAASFTVNSATSITAIVANGTSGDLVVQTRSAVASKAGFTYYALPTITSFSPTSAGAGATVTITGTNFSAISSVKFGGVEKTAMNVLSTTQMTAVVGVGATGDVTITNPAGTASLAGFTFIPAPTITSFSPTAAITGTVVQINGSNFNNVTSVKFGNVAASSFQVISSTRIDAVVAASSISGSVSVTTAGGTASLGGFTFTPVPYISSFSPTSGKTGTVVTISGSYFTGATAVTFGGTTASSFSVVNSGTITATVANGNSGDVAVTTGGGTITKSGFQYYPPPTLSSFTPTSVGTGSVVTITGTNLTGATAVSFGGTNATAFSVVNATTITASVAAGSSGNVSVTTPGGTVILAGFTFIPKPTITSFSPNTGGPGTIVTITGTNFSSVTDVYFGEQPVQSFTINSPSSITVIIPFINTYQSNVSVSVLSPGGNVTAAGTFAYYPPPTISSFSPASAKTGAAVVIQGTNFTSVTSITFGGVAATSFNVNSSTSVTAYVGNGSSGDVILNTSYGSATKSGFTYLPPPTITSFAPINAVTGTTITINGTNFTGATAVNFGGTPASSFSVVSPTQITAVVAAGSSGNVTVATPGGNVNLSGFLYTGITSVSPTSAATGTTVTITGINLSGTSAVSFGGVPAASFANVSSTTVTAVVANGASGNVLLTTPAGSTSKSGFIYTIPTPTITAFTPVTGGLGTVVTISGNNFTNASAVSFGGTVASSFQVLNSSTISAVVANGASGNVAVTTPGGTATKSGFTYAIPAPTISSFTPTTGGIGTEVTILGSNFTNASAVSFGGTAAASFIVNNSGSISATVGSGSTGAVSVTTPGGSHSFGSFAYYPAPTISGFNPANGKAGDSILISGSNLGGTNAISFGNMPAAGFRIVNNSSIKACLASGASGIVKLSTPGGTATMDGFTFSGPSISGFFPGSAAEGDTVTITGANLSGVTELYFGGFSPLSFSVINSTTIKALLAGGASGNVVAIAAGDTVSKPGFVFIAAPVIYSFTPASASTGSGIVIKGKYFSNTSSVMIGGVTAMNFTVINDSTIEAKTGQATQGKVTVTTPGGTASLAGFVFEPGACIGGTIYITSNITGESYQWQVNTGQGFSDISNAGNYAFAQTSVLRISNIPSTWVGYQYRCKVGAQYSTSFSLHSINQWIGSQNDAWENAANWQCGSLPDSNSDVRIKTSVVKINSDVRVRSLRLEAGAMVNIAVGKKLYISGRQALPVKIDKVGMAVGQYLLHPKTPGLILKPGESAAITVRKFSSEVTDSIPLGLTFTSNQPAVASVNVAGQVQALQPGVAMITATDGVGKKAYISVQVMTANTVPANSEPVFAGFSRPLYTINTAVGDRIPVSALNRLGIPLGLPVTLLVSASNYQNEFATASLVITPEGGFALSAKTGAIPLIGQSVMLALNASQSQGFSSAFLPASPSPTGVMDQGMQQMNAYSTPPPGLPQIFHVSLPFGIYPVIFTNKGLTSEPVWGNVFRLISYPIMFGGFWTGAYGIDIMVLSEEVPVEVESGAVVSASKSRLVSNQPGLEKWRVIPENFIGPWNKCQVFADYSGDWCSASDTYGHSLKIKIPKVPNVVLYEGPLSVPDNWLTGNLSKYYKNLTGVYAPGQAQLADGQVQYTDVATGVVLSKSTLEVGPIREVGTGIGFFEFERSKPLKKGDPFAGLYMEYINRSGRLKWVNNNEFEFEVFKAVDSTYSSWIAGGPFKRCNGAFAPVINSFVPTSGSADTTVTITGSGFINVTGVTFGTVAADSFAVVNDSTIRAVLSINGATGLVSVLTTSGIGTSTTEFTYIYKTPKIISITPATATPGTLITISGSNFVGISNVKFGEELVSFEVIDENTIRATAGSYGTGWVRVYNPAGYDDKVGFTLIFNKPAISSFTPNSGTDSAIVTIVGSNFISGGVFSTNLGEIISVTESSITVKINSGNKYWAKKLYIYASGGDDSSGIFYYSPRCGNSATIVFPEGGISGKIKNIYSGYPDNVCANFSLQEYTGNVGNGCFRTLASYNGGCAISLHFKERPVESGTLKIVSNQKANSLAADEIFLELGGAATTSVASVGSATAVVTGTTIKYKIENAQLVDPYGTIMYEISFEYIVDWNR